MNGYIVLQSGEVFQGEWLGGSPQAGEVVFNTSHSGYEEIATDPSYHKQIIVMTSPQMGNYGVDDDVWESNAIHIRGFVGLDIQFSQHEASWVQRLVQNDVPLISGLDTRLLVLHLREMGTVWGAAVQAGSEAAARKLSNQLIQEARSGEMDWAFATTCKQAYTVPGQVQSGPRIAVLDFGCKKNIIRELTQRCSEVRVFPSRTSSQEIKDYDPNGVLLSNGPGNPEDVLTAVDTIRDLLGWRTLFGICMGHQLLALALGGKTFKLKFGHRGSNHPIADELLNCVYITTQNHGYAVDPDSLPSSVNATHKNLNDSTLAGINCMEKKCFSVQFHPESHPGPRESVALFDHFIKRVL